jgi:hypothetical protein
MKAIVGTDQVFEHIGPAMAELMLQDVAQEHNEIQVLGKCRSWFKDGEAPCCRVRGHEGVCFARTWDRSLTRMVISHVWSW